MTKKRYVPGGSLLTCDKGTLPSRLVVTHHNNARIYGQHLASEMDMTPGENLTPMGVCAVTHGPCVPNPLFWDKTNQNVKVNGYKLLFEDACLLCKQGGKISITLVTPGALQAALGNAATGASLGAGAAALKVGNYTEVLDNIQRGVIYDVQNSKVSLVRPSPHSPDDLRRSGNYGEMNDNVYHRQEGWRDVRAEHPVVDIDKPTSPGIDGAYEKGGNLRVTDAKYNTARLKNTTNHGRELSNQWVRDHIDGGGINPRDEASLRAANRNGTLQREVIYTDKDGRAGLTSETQNDRAYKQTRGQSESLEIKQSRVGQLAEQVRSNIRNSKPMTALAESNFSQGVRGSRGAIRSNELLFKASQRVAASPALKVTGQVLGKGLVVVGIAFAVKDVVEAYQEEGEVGDKTQAAIGRGAGGLAGGIAGGEIGAIIGTCICPGVGTVIGGVVGGILGGIAGAFGGEWAAGWF